MVQQVSARWNPAEACRPIIDEAPIFYPTIEVIIFPNNGDMMSSGGLITSLIMIIILLILSNLSLIRNSKIPLVT